MDTLCPSVCLPLLLLLYIYWPSNLAGSACWTRIWSATNENIKLPCLGLGLRFSSPLEMEHFDGNLWKMRRKMQAKTAKLMRECQGKRDRERESARKNKEKENPLEATYHTYDIISADGCGPILFMAMMRWHLDSQPQPLGWRPRGQPCHPLEWLNQKSHQIMRVRCAACLEF